MLFLYGSVMVSRRIIVYYPKRDYIGGSGHLSQGQCFSGGPSKWLRLQRLLSETYKEAKQWGFGFRARGRGLIAEP